MSVCKTLAVYTPKNIAFNSATIAKDMRLAASGSSSLQTLFGNTNLYTFKNERVYVGESTALAVFTDFKKGEIYNGFKKIDPTFVVSNDAAKLLAVEVENYPARVLGVTEKSSASFLKEEPRLSSISTEKEFEDVVNTTQSSKLKQAYEWSVRNKKAIGYTIAVGFGIGLFASVIESKRKQMSGCFRYNYGKSGTTVCKVVGNSCKNPDIGGKVVACSGSVIDPQVAKGNCSTNPGDECVLCDSRNNNPEIANPNIEYLCQSPTFFGTLGDTFNNWTDNIFQIVDDVTNILSSGLNFIAILIKMLPFLLVFGGVLVLLYLLSKLAPAKKPPMDSGQSVSYGAPTKSDLQAPPLTQSQITNLNNIQAQQQAALNQTQRQQEFQRQQLNAQAQRQAQQQRQLNTNSAVLSTPTQPQNINQKPTPPPPPQPQKLRFSYV